MASLDPAWRLHGAQLEGLQLPATDGIFDLVQDVLNLTRTSMCAIAALFCPCLASAEVWDPLPQLLYCTVLLCDVICRLLRILPLRARSASP
jgi:hypothetical protein